MIKGGWIFYVIALLFALYWIFIIYLEIVTNKLYKKLCEGRQDRSKASFYLFGYAKKMRCLKEFSNNEEVKKVIKVDDTIKKLSAIMLLLLAFWIVKDKF